MHKLPIVPVSTVEEIEEYISPEMVFHVEEYKGFTYILSQFIGLRWEGLQVDLVNWLQEIYCDQF